MVKGFWVRSANSKETSGGKNQRCNFVGRELFLIAEPAKLRQSSLGQKEKKRSLGETARPTGGGGGFLILPSAPRASHMKTL